MLNVFATIPDAPILPVHSNQSTTTLAALMGRLVGIRGCGDTVGRVLLELSHKRRWPGVRGQNCKRVTGSRHRDVHHAALLSVGEALRLRRNEIQQWVVNDLRRET
jgi:hypothetical protein